MTKYSRLDFKTALPQIEGDVTEVKEWISSALDFFYPVGTVYETANAEFNPNVTWGGKWGKIEGRVLVGFDEDDSDTTYKFNTVGYQSTSANGEKKHKLITSEIPSHSHSISHSHNTSYVMTDALMTAVSGYPTHTDYNTGSSGGNGYHNNMPPYEVVVIWKRIE